MDQRLQQLQNWLQQQGIAFQKIAPASADASFRRYFRIHDGETTRIVMDAPPDKEDTAPFVHVAQLLLQAGLHVPEILQQDSQQGFLLLSDLGDTVFLSELNNQRVDEMYAAAMLSLLLMQQVPATSLPEYDRQLLLAEMQLFPEWYLQTHLSVTLNTAQQAILEKSFAMLVDNALQQPQVFVHRDYHSRNLMVNREQPHRPGIIDFQDAVKGAVTYDLVSLLKDCYIDWPREQVTGWVNGYYQQAVAQGIIEPVGADTFLRWFDLMGLQRHIKVAGIFSRLKHRDGKTGYLKDIPRTMDYIFDVLSRYSEFKPLQQLLQDVL